MVAEQLVATAGGAASMPHFRLWGVPRGGVPAAYAVHAALLGLGVGSTIVAEAKHANVLVDDIIDSGRTRERYTEEYAAFVALIDKRDPAGPYKNGWVVFPWEGDGSMDTSAEDIGVRLLQYIGEDPNREGLRETPKRWLAAMKEWTAGYGQDPVLMLKCFTDGAAGVDEMVIVRGIKVHSLCMHHLAQFHGTADVAYIPDGRVLGLSKVARLVNIFARRLQVQEKLTQEIADAMNLAPLAPKGVGVLLRCRHSCMESRGVREHDAVTVTSALRGAIKEDARARAEFLELTRQ